MHLFLLKLVNVRIKGTVFWVAISQIQHLIIGTFYSHQNVLRNGHRQDRIATVVNMFTDKIDSVWNNFLITMILGFNLKCIQTSQGL